MRDLASQVHVPSKHRPAIFGGAVLLLGVLLTSWAAQWTGRSNEKLEQQRVAAQVERMPGELAQLIQDYEKGVRGARGSVLVGGQEHISLPTFQIYARSRDIDQEFPGAQGFGFIRRVGADQVGEFLAEMRRSVSPDFHIHPATSGAGERDVVTVIEPADRNLATPGLDVSTDPEILGAASLALQSNGAALTAPIPSRERGARGAFRLLLLLPVYRPNLPHDSTAERQLATFGWAYVDLRGEKVLRQLSARYPGLTLQVSDVTADRAATPFFESGQPDVEVSASLDASSTVALYGRSWRITARPTLQFIAEMRVLQPATVLWLGSGAALLTAAFVAMLLMYLHRRHEQQLRTSGQFRLALEAAPTAMLLIDDLGTIVLVNAQTERLFGFDRVELVGRPVELLVPPRLRPQTPDQHPPANASVPGTPDLRRETIGLRKDGLEVPIEIALKCISTPDGEFVVASVSDIKERQHAEQLQQLMTAVVESAEDAIVTKSLDGIVRSWNPAAERLLGYRADEMIGQSGLTLMPADRQSEEAMILHRINMGNKVAHFQTVRRRKDGTLVDVSLTISPIRNRNGDVVGASKIMRDMTETKRAAEELRALNAQLETLLNQRSGQLQSAQRDLSAVIDALPSMVAYWDRNLRNRFANAAYARWFGLDSPETANAPIASVLGAALFDRLRPYVERALKGERVSFEETLSSSRGDGMRHVDVHFIPDETDQEVRGFYVLVHDITQVTQARLRQAKLLRENEGLLKTLNEHALVSVADRHGRIIDVNPGFCAISGYSRMELLGSDHRIVSSGVHPPEFWQQAWAQLDQGKPWRGEICNRTKSGELYWVDSIIAPFLDEHGEVEKYVSIRFDITAQKEAQRRLIESEMFLERVERVSGVGGFMIDLDTHTRRWTSQSYRIHDLDDDVVPTDELLNSLMSPAVLAQFDAARHSALETGNSYAVEAPITTRKGRQIWVRNVGEVEYRDGIPMRVIGTLQDITESRRAEIALRDSEQRLQLVTDNIPGLISQLDVNLRYRFVNRAYATWFDVDTTQMIGKSVREFYGDSVYAGIEGTLLKALGGDTVTAERDIVIAGGECRHCHVVLVPQRDRDGAVVGLFAIHTDITQRRQTELALRESESFLARSGAVAGVGGWEVDLRRDVMTWSDQTRHLHEVDQDYTPTLQGALGFYSPDSRALLEQSFRDCVAHGTPYDVEVELVSARGRRFWARATGAAEFEEGVPIRVVGAFQDISQQRALDAQLREAMRMAERANQAKSEFLANMSHEIRTPLNAVIGLGYLLEQTILSQDQQQLLAKIQLAGRSLLGVINNVLDLSKIEAGEMSLAEEPFALPDLVEEFAQLFAPQAEAKGIELRVRCAPDLPRMVTGDATRLRQILTNLLGNAIKFTHAGHVELFASCTEQSSSRLRLRFVVTDTGIGIEAAALQRLFTPFMQADASTTRRFGGTGLGLSIARRFAELMDGSIEVTSTVGVGSSFTVEVFLGLASDLKRVASARAMRILILGPGHDSTDDIEQIVRALGWSSIITGSTSLRDALSGTEADRWPDVIVAPLPLSDMTLERLNQQLSDATQSDWRPPLLIVADDVAAYTRYQPLMRAEDVLLVRPLNSSTLFNAVNSAVAKRPQSRERIALSTQFDQRLVQWLSGVRVLVADDSEINRDVARRILERQGALVTTCVDGQEAVRQVEADGQHLDIVLMDVQMPVMDGNEATRRIRGELGLRQLPIIALTAGALLSERQRALESGMSDFVTKPFEPAALIRTIRRLVEQARGAAIPITQITPVEPEGSVAGSLESVPASIDPSVVRQMYGDDHGLLRSLVARVLRDFAEFLLPIAVSDDDALLRGELRARAHKLKGSAGIIGATQIMHLAGAAESALEQGQGADSIEAILRRLSAALTTLQEEAAPWLADQQQSASLRGRAADPRAPLQATDIEALHALLQAQNLAAMDSFAALAGSLEAAMGSEAFARLRDAVDNLDFSQGAELLRALMPSATSAAHAR